MPVVRADHVPLSRYTTLRLGGQAASFAEVSTEAELVELVLEADRAGQPVLVLGGGSNLVVADYGFPGTVLRVGTAGVSVREADEQVLVTVAAGEPWDQFVDWAVAEKLSGIECLAGIPGLAGATPIQNVGAYGQEVSATISSVTALDRASSQRSTSQRSTSQRSTSQRSTSQRSTSQRSTSQRSTSQRSTLSGSQCRFGYRTSLFKTTGWPVDAHGASPSPTGRYVVTEVTFALYRDPMSRPVKYAELAGRLGVGVGEQAPLADVRDAVLELRRGKGMVLDPADPDTRSAGSFFTNPVLDSAQLAEVERRAEARSPGVRVPSFAAADGHVKVPAGWLIEHAGFAKGHPGHGRARISSKHTLALTNWGDATAADLLALAREVVAGVQESFGVVLANEPTFVGLHL